MGIVIPFPVERMAPTSDRTAELARDDGVRWAQWMAAAQAGDRAAYHALLTAIAPYLRAIAYRYVGGNDADDAVQDILIVMHEIRHTYEPDRAFKPWLSTIATRRCIDLLRKRVRRTAHQIDDEDAFDALHDGDPNPEESLARAQQAHDVHRAVGRLSPKMRDAVTLVHLEELSIDEAARRAGQASGTLKVAAHRALKSLRSALSTREPRDG